MSKIFRRNWGDKYSDYLTKTKQLSNCNKVLKDQISWKTLNAYCAGEKLIEGVSLEAFLEMFFEFIREKDAEDLKYTKSSGTTKVLHIISFMCLKLACKEIEDKGVGYQKIKFRNGFPGIVILCDL